MKQQKILQMAKDICRVKLNCNDVCNPISACDALKYAERAVEAGYSKPEWISVEDDSPKENGIYCVMVEHCKSRKYKQRTHAKYKNGRWLDLYDNWENSCWKVTHWMPLPEAPKGGAE